MRKILNMQLFAMTILTLALAPCAFNAEIGIASGGTLERVQEPETTLEVAQEASELSELGNEGDTEAVDKSVDENPAYTAPPSDQ